jgi:hypothetical protein
MGGALASGFATTELHHHSGRDPKRLDTEVFIAWAAVTGSLLG